ncbi:sensor histidine kinase [Desulfocurvus vexinensis]|uniref:sensor histidine kinase n=1 Tax=Desulfocurvus vexinensis TaxID=399548 RepID=UPI00048ACA6A|nr:HAMP domain-containing sensor histidine kinase [Desulfocurvus vexinensis]
MTRTPKNDCAQDPVASGAQAIARRIRDKAGAYARYDFSEAQSGALNIFFDLVQEFDAEEDFHAVCVLVPHELFGLGSALYLVTRDLSLRCAQASGPGAVAPRRALAGLRGAPAQPAEGDGHLYLPIRANAEHVQQLPFDPPGGVIGCLELFPAARLAGGDGLFWEKYANRIGFQMHNRIVQGANRRHLRFIRNLAKDIGHNVIVPNMYFKLFFNRLKRTIDQLGEVPGRHAAPSSESRREILALHEALREQYDEISRHYEQTSLYLETLLRQSHFEKGHYVLERRACHVPTQIIAPQLHQFLPRFQERGIAVTPCPDCADDPGLTLSVDVGLIAQVFSNLFSNALKYTAPPPDGGPKALVCSASHAPGRLGRGRDAVDFSIFTTGTPLAPADGARLFEAGFRAGDNLADGTGHGLFFVRQIVELHGGRALYEAVPGGNVFHVLLPARAPEEAPP